LKPPKHPIPDELIMTRIFLLFLLAAISFGGSASGQTKLFSVRLQDYGYAPIVHPKPGGEGDVAMTNHLAIGSDGRVYVGFSMEGGPRLLKQGETNNTFRVLTIGPENGAVGRTLDFPTTSIVRVGIELTASDALLVAANEKVMLLGNDGSPKATFDVPALHEPGWPAQLKIRESPSGRTLLISTNERNLYFLSSETLSPIAQCRLPSKQDWPDTFSDKMKINMFQDERYFPPTDELRDGPYCGLTALLRPIGSQMVTPFFLDDSTLLGVGEEPWFSGQPVNGSPLWAVKSDGTPLWSMPLPKHFTFEDNPVVSVARDGSRFALWVQQFTGGVTHFHSSFQTDVKILDASLVVYDARTGKQVSSINPNPIAHTGLLEFALSPHGDILATLQGGILQVWKL
jgi:hypothetical protein